MDEWVRLGRSVGPTWTAARSNGVRDGIRRRAVRRRTAIGVAMIACAFVVVLLAGSRWRSHASVVIAGAPAIPTVQAPPANAQAHEVEVEVDAVTPIGDAVLSSTGDRAYALEKGAARFVVHHDEAKPFVVHAGDVVVEDLGTVFTVAFVEEGDRLSVTVESGSVRVVHDGEAIDVGPGEHVEVAAHSKKASPVPAAMLAPKKDADQVAALLAQADTARREGRASDAIAPLRTIVRDHGKDPRADAAAFTLGRILLDEGDPTGAADAFEHARAHEGPIAEDALGREVLALARAGQADRARVLADEYGRRYPRGVRAKEVSRFATPR